MLPSCLSRCLTLSLPLLFGSLVAAQTPRSFSTTDLRRFEIGGQVADVRLLPCDVSQYCPTPQLALGPAFAWNVTPHFAVGSTVSFFPGIDKSSGVSVDGDVLGGRPTEVPFDARGSLRAGRYAFFLNASPGFVSWSKIPAGFKFTVVPDGYSATSVYGRGTYFATQLGGGIEASLSSR